MGTVNNLPTLSRRRFLGTATAGLAFARSAAANPLGLPLGCQVFPVRDQLAKDFPGTLHALSALGYRLIEFCSPPGYLEAGFAPLAGLKARDIRGAIEDAGLQVVSCHYQFGELKEHLDERIAFARELGLRHMIVATLALPESASLDDWRKAAGDMNRLGERTAKAGLQLGFHNHHFEFRDIGGVLIFDELMRRFDPKLVKSQFQVNVVSLGFDPAEHLARYPGRFLSLHLQDWSAAEKKDVAIGRGVIDWQKLFAAANTAGIEYYFVEMGMAQLEASVPYLRNLRV